MTVEKNQVAIKRQKILFQRVLIAQQDLVCKAAALRVDKRNLPAPLAYQIVTGRFRRECVVKMNTVRPFAFQTVDQHHVRTVDIERKPGADNQHVVA